MSAKAGFVCLVAGDEHYAVRDSRVLLIARSDQMTAESAADGRIGTIAIGRGVVPVHAMSRVLGVPGAGQGRHVVVTDGPSGPIGWSVDHVQRASLQTAQGAATLVRLPSLAGPRPAAWFEGLALGDDRPMLVLSASCDPGGCGQADNQPSEAAGRIAEPPARGPEAVRASLVVIFTTPALPALAGDRFALSARQVVSVSSALTIVRVPGSPAHVAGVAVCNGELATILDCRHSAERPVHGGRGLRLIVARTGSRWMSEAVAFPVGTAVALRRPTTEECARCAVEAPPPFLLGLFDVAGERIGLLNLDGLAGGDYDAA